jgi:hypothetical protein
LLPAVQVAFKSTSVATSSKKIVVQMSRSAIASTPAAITAKSLIAATTMSVGERYDGSYGIKLTTDAGTYGKITWGLDATTLQVDSSVFAVSYSCDPAQNAAAANAPDQNPTFNIDTSYACTIGLAPNSGSDQFVQSKQFSFTTGAGQLVVTPPTSMDTVLHDSNDAGGLVFSNENNSPITITGLDLDLSYTALDTANNPVILEFLDPDTNAPLANYHLETLAADPASPYTYAGTNINIPLSFTIAAGIQKMLPVSIVGVQRMQISGVNPAITISVRGVTSDQNLNRTVLHGATISWSCVTVPVGSYNPNATSGPYATGQVCEQ